MAAIFIHFPISGTLLDKFVCSSHEQTAIHPASCEDSSRHPGRLRPFFSCQEMVVQDASIIRLPNTEAKSSEDLQSLYRCDRDIFVSFVGYNALTLLQPAGFQSDTIFTIFGRINIPKSQRIPSPFIFNTSQKPW